MESGDGREEDKKFTKYEYERGSTMSDHEIHSTRSVGSGHSSHASHTSYTSHIQQGAKADKGEKADKTDKGVEINQKDEMEKSDELKEEEEDGGDSGGAERAGGLEKTGQGQQGQDINAKVQQDLQKIQQEQAAGANAQGQQAPQGGNPAGGAKPLGAQHASVQVLTQDYEQGLQSQQLNPELQQQAEQVLQENGVDVDQIKGDLRQQGGAAGANKAGREK